MPGINQIQPVAGNVQAPTPMSLGDMVNLARGVQAYQQAEQINPLSLQAAKEELTQKQVKTEQDVMGLAQKKFKHIADSQISMINNPLVIAAEQNPNAVNKDELVKQVTQNGITTAKALGIPQGQAMELLQPYIQLAQTNPSALRQYYKERHIQGLDEGARSNVLGNVGISTQPTAPAAVPAAPTSQPQTAFKLPYPVRSGAQPYVPEPTEAKDQAAGQEYRNSLVSRQSTLATDRRNVEETIGQAEKIAGQLTFKSGGFLGDVERRIRTAVASEDYKMLAKDLANLQMSNLRTLGQGGNTVAGMDLTRVASGDETVPPETLIKIARRAQADMTNIDMQANGAEQFKNRFGDNNMNAFKQLWNANADSKIFEAMNIIRDVESPEERQKRLKELFPTQSKHQEFLTKYRNIKKLSETGSL